MPGKKKKTAIKLKLNASQWETLKATLPNPDYVGILGVGRKYEPCVLVEKALAAMNDAIEKAR